MTNVPGSERQLPPLDQYVVDLFAPEDDALKWIQSEADRNGLPQISIRPFEGRLLQILMKAIVARKVLEIGTLAGYSTVWMARALPPDGKLITLEKSSKHAEVARASFAKAEVANKVVLWEGNAPDLLQKATAQAAFDFVFMDADKAGYLGYLEWATENLRPGGIVAAHNAYRNGRILAPESDDDRAIAAFNEALAHNNRFESTIIGVGDALAVGIKKA